MSQPRTQMDVLLAEDNEDDVILIREAFRELDRVRFVGVVNDGSTALAFLRKSGEYRDAPKPHFVLLDINMPGKNGLEVLQEIKRSPELRALPVAILTTSDRDEDVSRTFAEGACSYISKPSNLAAFRRLAERFERYWMGASRLPGTKTESQ
jgi:CheY-like chemotaxis protein